MGGFYRNVFTPEQLKVEGPGYSTTGSIGCTHARKVPVDWKEKPDPLVQQMIEAARSPDIFAAYLAACGKITCCYLRICSIGELVSLFFPNLGLRGFQAVLKYAVNAKIITRTEYAGAIALVSFQHEYCRWTQLPLWHHLKAMQRVAGAVFPTGELYRRKDPGLAIPLKCHGRVPYAKIVDPWFEESRTVKGSEYDDRETLRHSGDNFGR